jgi:thiol-disulfide isomerase/thioredoxin
MRLAIVFAIAILLFGCTGQGPATGTDGAGNGQAQGGLAPEVVIQEPSPPLPNTANLSYSRDVSDVLNTDSKNIENPNFDFSNITDTEGRLIVHFFYLPKCSACLGIKPEIDRLESAYPDTVFKRYDLTTPNGSVAYNTFANQLNLSKSQRYVPQVLVNGTVITDRFNINSTLETIVKGYG